MRVASVLILLAVLLGAGLLISDGAVLYGVLLALGGTAVGVTLARSGGKAE